MAGHCKDSACVQFGDPAFHLLMDCFWCEIVTGHLTLLEAEEAKWLSKSQLYDVSWLPADLMLIKEIERQMPEKGNKPGLICR
ncbi:MAG: hypothetical protein HFH49_03370 [Lachnospiraceae bacterium]|nr:hypothetical protein [Lachnospiraceae bacterium]